MKIIWGEGHKATLWSCLLILVLPQALVCIFYVLHSDTKKAENKNLLFGKKSHIFCMERCGFGVTEWWRCEKMSILSKSWSQVKYQADIHVLQEISQQLLPATWKKIFVLWSATPFRDVLKQLWGVRGSHDLAIILATLLGENLWIYFSHILSLPANILVVSSTPKWAWGDFVSSVVTFEWPHETRTRWWSDLIKYSFRKTPCHTVLGRIVQNRILGIKQNSGLAPWKRERVWNGEGCFFCHGKEFSILASFTRM